MTDALIVLIGTAVAVWVLCHWPDPAKREERLLRSLGRVDMRKRL